MLRYAGIGSRETPDRIILTMQALGRYLAEKGWVLRSGGADGADTAFEQGCDAMQGPKEIFLPWSGFNKNMSALTEPTEGAFKLASTIHPNYQRLRQPARRLIARNMHQILGASLLEPVNCVICWTKDGCQTAEEYGRETGGTGSAIKLASLNGIPVFNLQRMPQAIDDILDFINKEPNDQAPFVF